MFLISIQYNTINMAARENSMGTCHTSKTNVNLGFSSGRHWFSRGHNLPRHLLSQHLYNMTLETMLIKRQLMLVQNDHCILKDNLTEGLDFGNKKSHPFTV